LVGAHALQPGALHRGLDHVEVGLVEVERPPGLEVRLLAETHHHETGLLVHVASRFAPRAAAIKCVWSHGSCIGRARLRSRIYRICGAPPTERSILSRA